MNKEVNKMAIKKVVKYLSDKGFEFTFEPIESSLKTIKTKKGYEARYLIQDNDAEDIRTFCDNLGTMVCFHNRYSLGDKTDLTSDMFEGWGELKKYLLKEKKAEVIAPLYLYDHSGLRMKIGDFYGLLPQGHARFDSGQVGFIYVTKEDILKNWQKKTLTKTLKKKAKEVLEGEVESYDQYLVGDVYCAVKETYNKNKEQIDYDVVGGFYGYEDSVKALETEI